MTDRGEYFDNWMVFKRVKNIAIGNYAIPHTRIIYANI
jgi:hypothetical protein